MELTWALQRSSMAVVIAAFWAAVALAQSDQAPAPTYNVGDRWTFDRLVPPDRREPWVDVVREVTPDGVVVGKNGRKFSPVFNPLDQAGREIPLLRFPLAVGNSWDHAHDWSSPTGNLKTTTSLSYKVVGIEDVTVPAGTFRAYRLQSRGFVKDRSTITPIPSDARAEENYWYAPAVKRIVKYEGKHVKWVSPQWVVTWDLRYEMTGYQLAPQASVGN